MKSYKMGSDWLAEEENCGFKEKKMITVRCRSDRWCCVQSGRGGKLGSWDLAFDVVLLDTYLPEQCGHGDGNAIYLLLGRTVVLTMIDPGVF